MNQNALMKELIYDVQDCLSANGLKGTPVIEIFQPLDRRGWRIRIDVEATTDERP